MGKRPRIEAQNRYPVGHVVWRTTEHRENGITFGLYIDVEGAEKKPALFSGHVQRGMATQLRRFAHHLDDLEAKLPPDEGAA